MTLRDLLTTEEVAAELGVTPGRVRQLVRDGKLQPENLTLRAHLFCRDAVQAYKVAPKPLKGRPRKD